VEPRHQPGLAPAGRADHAGLQTLLGDLNRLYRSEPALWEAENDPASFRWIDASDADNNVVSFLRTVPGGDGLLVCVCNLSPLVRYGYRLGLPEPGTYLEAINTDASVYGGSGVGNLGRIEAENRPWHGLPCSAEIVLPPLATLWFRLP
jgi:1,4-alpha-glucan branching enzyme